jgi:hypothetical protein
MNIHYRVQDIYTSERASVRHRVLYVIIQKGKRMTSTNYYVIHKTGRRLKVSCIGFCHDKKLRQAMLENIAKIEHGRIRDYRIEEEKIIERPAIGRVGTNADYKQFAFD